MPADAHRDAHRAAHTHPFETDGSGRERPTGRSGVEGEQRDDVEGDDPHAPGDAWWDADAGAPRETRETPAGRRAGEANDRRDPLSDRDGARASRDAGTATATDATDADTVSADAGTAAFEARFAAVERRLDELDAAVQALGGAVGDVEHVNETVERRANAALAAVERPPADHPVPEIPADEPASGAATDDGLLGRLLGR